MRRNGRRASAMHSDIDLAAVFSGTSDGDGKLHLNSVEHARMRELLTRMRGRIEIVIRRRVCDRSYDQNRYYWGVVLKLISDHTGHTPQELHEQFKTRFGVSSTAELSTKAFTEYIERICALAATENIVIPEPDQVTTDFKR